MCQYVFALYILFSAWFAFSDDVTEIAQLKHERDVRLRLREKTLRSGERLQRRTQRKRRLRTVESADDRLERLQRRRERYRQLRTADRESADDRLTSAKMKTNNASVI